MITTNSILDEIMPKWQSREIHKIEMPDTKGNVMKVIEELTWADVPFFRKSINLLSFGKKKYPNDKVLDLFINSGLYKIAYSSADELVLVGILPVSDKTKKIELGINKLEDFKKLNDAKTVKIAMNFLLRDNILSTETRNKPTDRYSCIFFTAYWLMIRFGSGFIRRSWLKGIRSKILKNNNL